MEDQTQQQPLVDDEVAAEAAAESEDEASVESGESEATVDPNAVFRAAIGRAPSLKPLDIDADGESAGDSSSEDDDESPDVKPSEGKPLGRRAAADRIAELERQLAERDPEKMRQQVVDQMAAEARQQSETDQAKADAQRFLDLRDLPDDHPRLSEGDNWAWLQEQKRLRADYPKAVASIRSEYETLLERERGNLNTRESALWTDIRGQMTRAAQRKGVDFDRYRGQPNFESMGGYLYDAGWQARQDEIDALTRERDELKAERDQQLRYSGPRGLAAARAPLAAGRSSPGTPEPSINDVFRRVAFGRGG